MNVRMITPLLFTGISRMRALIFSAAVMIHLQKDSNMRTQEHAPGIHAR